MNKKVSIELLTENIAFQTIAATVDLTNFTINVSKIGTSGKILFSGVIVDENQVDTLISQINKQ